MGLRYLFLYLDFLFYDKSLFLTNLPLAWMNSNSVLGWLLFYCCNKISWTSQLQKKKIIWTNSFWDLDGGMEGAESRLTSGAQVEGSNNEWQAHTESGLWPVRGFETAKPNTIDILSPIRPHLLDISKQIYQLGKQCSNTRASGRQFYPNHYIV